MYILKSIKGHVETMHRPGTHYDVTDMVALQKFGRKLDADGNPIPGTEVKVPPGAGLRIQLMHGDKTKTEIWLPNDADVVYVMMPTAEQAKTVASYRYPPPERSVPKPTHEPMKEVSHETQMS